MASASTGQDRAHRVSGIAVRLSSANGLLAVLALVKIALHLLTAGNYGYFRDELYFIDAGKHLDWGYVDFPLLVALIAAAVHTLLGDSLLAIHILPAVAGAGVVVLSGLMARALGGGRFAQMLAALAALAAPTILGIDADFSMNPFDELWWALASLLILLILRDNQLRPRRWLLLGLVVGIGLETKLTIAFFVAALAVGFLLTPQRILLRSRWPWIAAAIAALLLLPYVLWQIPHDWTTVSFWRSYPQRNDHVSAPGFLIVQVLTMNVVAAPLWLGGLYYYLFSTHGRSYRVLGWIFALLYVFFTLDHIKYYFLAPAFPMLFAAGALVVEQLGRQLRWQYLPAAYIWSLSCSGAILAVITLPVLPPAVLAEVTAPARLGATFGIAHEPQPADQLPQPFADRLGWPEMAATVARVYHGLSAAEQRSACVLALNYGEAGAMDMYGPTYHAPPTVSGDDNYYFWGPGSCSGAVMITLGWSRGALAAMFGNVEQATIIRCGYCTPDENNHPVFIVRQPMMPLRRLWPRMKVYI